MSTNYLDNYESNMRTKITPQVYNDIIETLHNNYEIEEFQDDNYQQDLENDDGELEQDTMDDDAAYDDAMEGFEGDVLEGKQGKQGKQGKPCKKGYMPITGQCLDYNSDDVNEDDVNEDDVNEDDMEEFEDLNARGGPRGGPRMGPRTPKPRGAYQDVNEDDVNEDDVNEDDVNEDDVNEDDMEGFENNEDMEGFENNEDMDLWACYPSEQVENFEDNNSISYNAEGDLVENANNSNNGGSFECVIKNSDDDMSKLYLYLALAVIALVIIYLLICKNK